MSLPELPASYTDTRLALHRVAEHVIKPAREQATGHEISLRALPGGFGTPALPGGAWVRVDGAELVRDGEREAIDGADPQAAAVIARVFAFGTALLDALRDGVSDATIVRLWPEHFDLATELGDEAAGQRANYGVSPGDDEHPEPYVYVGPWSTGGYEALGWAQLRAFDDPHAEALAWLRERQAALAT